MNETKAPKRSQTRPPVPLYRKIKRFILEKIHSGEWRANHKIPSENELAKMLDVSRMTACRALRELTEQGVLVRSQGLGTFVASYKTESSLIAVRDIADEIRSRNRTHSSKVLVAEEVPATDVYAGVFSVMLEYSLYHSIVVHFEDDIPLMLENRYVNPAAIPEYLKQDFTRVTPTAYLNSIIPFPRIQHVVEAVCPTEEERAWLQLEEQEPCLRVSRKTWIEDMVITATALLYPGSRYRLEGHFQP